MVINGSALCDLAPIQDMEFLKHRQFGVSYGLAEVGYDIRLKQEILFVPGDIFTSYRTFVEVNDDPKIRPTIFPKTVEFKTQAISEIYCFDDGDISSLTYGSFVLASAMEHFQMPLNLVGIVHDKSTWARQGLSVFNTVIEPGWEGFLTLELSFRGNEPLHIPAGAGIAQVIFHKTTQESAYSGKYQNQDDRPVASMFV